jgi:hypothetical protein
MKEHSRQTALMTRHFVKNAAMTVFRIILGTPYRQMMRWTKARIKIGARDIRPFYQKILGL